MNKDYLIKITEGLNKACSEVLPNEPLKNHTTFRVGGPCIALALPKCLEELKSTVDFCKTNEVPFFIIGRGSNVLASDKGFNGVVIKPSGRFSEITYDEATEIITAGAGCTLSQLAAFACEKGFSGFEFASGIPGSVGGGVRMNAGAYGGEIVQVLTSCTFMDNEGSVLNLSNEALCLSYRHSIFCENPEWIILSASFKGTVKKPQGEIRQTMLELNLRRKEKQPLEYPSAGSTFKRPEGYFAAKLIEDAGLKGFTYKNAGVSSKHSGFVINLGEASCEDIFYVIKYVKNVVFEKFGVTLEPEVVFLGEFNEAI